MRQLRSVLAFLRSIEGLPIAGVLAVMYLVFLLTAPTVFSRYPIYKSFFETVPAMLICALGLTFVVTAGEMDLSFPAVVAFAGFVFAWCFKNIDSPWAPWLGFVLALGAGGLIGYINGILVARIGVPSIMATLAGQFFWYGMTILLAGGLQMDIRAIRGTPIHNIFAGELFDTIPTQAIWAALLAIFLWFILNRHRFGEAITFIGDNANVARVMGINVERTRVRLFVMNGMIAAFAGLLLTMNMNVFFPTQGQGYLLQTMAAVFIGGTSIAGGHGVIVGSFFGAYIIGSLEAGVVASRISGYWVQLVQGMVMAAVVVLNIVIEERSIAKLSSRIRHWTVSSRNSHAGPGAEPGEVFSK